MKGKFKEILTLKNICLFIVVIICTLLIFKIALSMIFPDNNIKGAQVDSARGVVEKFVKDIKSKEKIKAKDYMVSGWKEDEMKSLIIGYKDLESLNIEKITLDKYSEYCPKYEKERKGDRYASFTVELKHDYKKKSKYKSEVKTMVFILEKTKGNWRIVTFGTRATMGSLI